MATPFRYFLGGKSGTGKQIMSWVSLRDLVAAIEFIFDHPDLTSMDRSTLFHQEPVAIGFLPKALVKL